MFEGVFLEYFVLIAVVLIGTSAAADFLPSDVGAPLNAIVIRAFVALVLVALVVEAPRYFGNATNEIVPAAAKGRTP
jgi:hypothetical protein